MPSSKRMIQTCSSAVSSCMLKRQYLPRMVVILCLGVGVTAAYGFRERAFVPGMIALGTGLAGLNRGPLHAAIETLTQRWQVEPVRDSSAGRRFCSCRPAADTAFEKRSRGAVARIFRWRRLSASPTLRPGAKHGPVFQGANSLAGF